MQVQDGTRTARLAVHLNVVLTSGGESVDRSADSRSSVRIEGTHFHLTARPFNSQDLINQAGASVLTAAE